MSFEYFIARRYLTAKRKQAFISVITFISVLGITIGVMALVIAIALITGFQNDVQDKILGSTSHIMISDITGEGMSDYQELMAEVQKIEGVISATPVLYDTVLLNGPYKSSGAILRGVDFSVEIKFSDWLKNLQAGRMPSNQDNKEILLGRDLAFNMGAGIGDVITVLTSSLRLSPVGPIPRRKQFEVVGIFRTGLYEFDSSSAFISLSAAQDLYKQENRISMLNVRIEDIFKAPNIVEKIEIILTPEHFATTWMKLNEPLFSALKLEKKLLFFTITLIVLVAALNIIATLILMVMEKTRDIGILIAMGTTARRIKKIFFVQGAMIGVIGTTMGTLLGLIWCWFANTYELIKLPVDIYPISYVPFRLGMLDLLMIIGITLFITFLSTLFPAHRASKVNPVMALKYE
ncbi:MAG: ABC transporter permease [Candidatus Aminicenantes bacterium]|nr:ABC transporter permease [Candidatus Aminicenantes bacterium]